jgi:hypothetical protein
VEIVSNNAVEKELVAEKKFIVFNKNQKEIEERNYKTAIGTLGFNQ